MEHPRRTAGVRQILAEPGTKFGIVVAIGALVMAGTRLASGGPAQRPIRPGGHAAGGGDR